MPRRKIVAIWRGYTFAAGERRKPFFITTSAATICPATVAAAAPAIADASRIHVRRACNRHRNVRIPHYRHQLSADGHVADFPGVLSGGGVQPEKLGTHGHPDGRAVRPSRLFVLAFRAALVLADVSGHGAFDKRCGLRVLPAVSPKE